MDKNLFLFIIWDKAKLYKTEILNDLGKKFEIRNIFNVNWSKDNFINNLARFYCDSKTSIFDKAKYDTGFEQFTVVLVNDYNPKYEYRQTSRGRELVNSNIYDAKQEYRSIVGGTKIHSTNNSAETNSNLTLLFGLNTIDFCKKYQKTYEAIDYNHDLFGLKFNNNSEVFYLLNNCTNYCILRNFDSLPETPVSGMHSDIDLLCENKDALSLILNGEKEYEEEYRVRFKVNVESQCLYFDIREIGDDYYCRDLEKEILASKQLNKNGIYIPNEELYFYSLIYHALIHKNKMSEDYRQIINKLANKNGIDISVGYDDCLKGWLISNDYHITKPKDSSVYFNIENANKILPHSNLTFFFAEKKQKIINIISASFRVLFKPVISNTHKICDSKFFYRLFFNRKYYRNQCSASMDEGVDLFDHYLEIGWKKGYDPSRLFSTTKYLKNRPDVLEANMCPLIHYCRHGIWEGQKRYLVDKNINTFFPDIFNLIFKKLYSHSITKNSDKKLLIVIHSDNNKIFDIIKNYFINLNNYQYKIVVISSQSDLKNNKYNNIDIICGCTDFSIDKIGSYVDLNSFDYLFFVSEENLKTKYLYFPDNNFAVKEDKLFKYELDSLLSSYNIHKIVKFLSTDNGSLVYHKNFSITNNSLADSILSLFDFSYLNNCRKFEYCSLDCYAVKINLLSKVINDKATTFDLSINKNKNIKLLMEAYVVKNNLKKLLIKNISFNIFSFLNAAYFKKHLGTNLINNTVFPSEVIKRNFNRCVNSITFKRISIEQINVKYGEYSTPYKIYDTVPFKYLDNHDDALYIKYCKNNRRLDYLDLNDEQFNNLEDIKFIDRYKKIINGYSINDYDCAINPVLVDSHLNLQDGLHRLCVLYKKYGNISIDVCMIDYNNNVTIVI